MLVVSYLQIVEGARSYILTGAFRSSLATRQHFEKNPLPGRIRFSRYLGSARTELTRYSAPLPVSIDYLSLPSHLARLKPLCLLTP